MAAGLFYVNNLPLCVGDVIYTDNAKTIPASQGAYSDGVYCYIVDSVCGKIIKIKPCATPTPTPTPTPTSTP